MTALILHKVKNGFLVAIHAGEKFIDLSEAFVAHSAAELVEHIESHFSKPAPTQATTMVPADAVLASLNGAKDALAEPPTLTEQAQPSAPAAQVQA